MTKKVILYTLQTFSTTGGIQKMTRTMAHSLNVLSQRCGWDFQLWSAYDSNEDLMLQYLPAENFVGFGGSRTSFVLKTILLRKRPDIVIISHVNLAIIGLLIKLIKPRSKVWLIAHGIEVWRPLSATKKMFLKRCDKVVCVSNFTKGQMMSRHKLCEQACQVLNNAIDPFMRLPENFAKPAQLLERYRLTAETPVIFTLTRLASTEQYKGHDQVIKVLCNLKQRYPGIRYILAGQYDHQEELRIHRLISEAKVDNDVILTGFISEEEITAHFLLADLFVLPSKKEGFGIVFIEALACGLPVVCGNADGSIDAIRNGKLGTAVNADNPAELENAICNYLDIPLTVERRQDLRQACLAEFNDNDYIDTLEKMLADD
ncbi:glycosyltransferase family 4 protein [Mucilaginibacter sp. L3T2-6]|uniref:glycosyltransferase family 4 protein n=1 Tax=Mucilaginibacter sp. L3T2-6 TaxID=3062491 RepID=UPI002674AEC5|nr:glycosyltransferase family 4 protein [Mucilaginibacter sp. L3T2-6]MDO3643048.1 glycosyltransferase family 4 protein [Mucilaginibacter sp. L3T2-6]MDV6215815.1 glycosyltransferase family 4 protein [Mucilaginibacter sp. L3T2-6]